MQMQLEEKKTHMFRGAPALLVGLWFWNLLWMTTMLVTGARAGQSSTMVIGLFTFAIWGVCEWCRRMENQRYDEQYELRAAVVRAWERDPRA